jgi:hypothetical protein
MEWALGRIGFSDDVQRLLPIAVGTVTVVMISRWVALRFGRRAGLLVGILTALSPLGIRYSQELRPYPYLIFFVVLTFFTVDRLIEDLRWRSWFVLLTAATGGLYSHYFYFLVALPSGILLVERSLSRDVLMRARGRRALGAAAAAGALALVAFLPWLGRLLNLGSHSSTGGAPIWDFAAAGLRWQFLTVGAREGEPLTLLGALLLVLFAVGAGVAMTSARGRAVLVGAIGGTVGAEFMLHLGHHWSNARYDTVGWVFVVVLIGIGLAKCCVFVNRRWAFPLAVGLSLLAGAVAVAAYDQRGRQHWDLVAKAVRHLHRPGEPVFTENEWTYASLGYYLVGPDFQSRSQVDLPLVAVNGDLTRLRALWPADGCAIFVTAGVPHFDVIRRGLHEFPLLASYPYTDEADIFLLTPVVRQKMLEAGMREIGPGVVGTNSCGSDLRVLPYSLRGPDGGVLEAARRGLHDWYSRTPAVSGY